MQRDTRTFYLVDKPDILGFDSISLAKEEADIFLMSDCDQWVTKIWDGNSIELSLDTDK